MKKFTLMLLLLTMLFGGCVSMPIEYEYTAQSVSYFEKEANFSFSLEADYTETKNAKYYFEKSIEDAERTLCIESTEAILQQIDIKEHIPEIYCFSSDTYDDIYLSEHKLYTSIRDFASVEYVADVLLAVYGEFTHYGLVYGYAEMICRDLKWLQESKGEISRPTQTAIYDLNLLCFEEAFSFAEDIACAKRISVDFAETYLAKHGKEALQTLLAKSDTDDGMAHLQEELTVYYQNQGIDASPSALQIGYGGKTYDYVVKSDLATFYIGAGWIDENKGKNPLVSEHFLHENYTEVKDFFETTLLQMKQYQALFALDAYDNDLAIVFSNSKKLSQYSFYQQATHKIFLMNVDSLMHEYIHAMTQPSSQMALWETEGFARYFSYRYDRYGIAFLNEDYNHTPKTNATLYVHEYLETLDRPIDMAIDYMELENIAVYSRGYREPNTGYVAGSSFVQYLVREYGEDAVIASIYGAGVPLPKAYDALVKDWNEYIEKNYQNYSKFGG